ncbi:hypothetical protein [Fredinandcohnia quinoae]|uniref:Uncharacterized protein n=1 Tax=Fredinandcohnia quinoae TaxID=2918902 RepID=A0AAW5E2S0_9BACI|nr:hypothetical protein [Fredinandcohnia sp. SECRCQ15]MCH1624172.1 hypothetical protein [Fredinandcohnia sp. SECRCQ15]
MNTNFLYYLGLAIISIILLIYVCYKIGVRQGLLTFFAMVGLGYLIEAVIFNLLNSYQYYPNIIKRDPIYDSTLGAIVSNALSLPVAATYLAAFRKNWVWILCTVALFAGIEWLFLRVDIYKHHWWKIGYTSMGLPFYFYSAKFLYKKMAHPLEGILHAICLFLIISPFSGSFQFTPIMIFSNRYYDFGWFMDRSRDTVAFAALFYLCSSLFYVAITRLFHHRRKWGKYILTPFTMLFANILLKKIGILHSLVWWDTSYYVLISILSVLLTEIISKNLNNGPST